MTATTIQPQLRNFGLAGFMILIAFAASVTMTLGGARPASAQSYGGYPTMPGYVMPMPMPSGYSSMAAPGYAMMGYGSYGSSAATASAGVGISWEYCTIPGGGPIWIPWGSPTNGLLC